MSSHCVQYPDFVVTLNEALGIRTIRFNVPRRKNAFKGQMFLDIKRMLREAANDERTKILVLTGTGDYFSSGNDLNNFNPTSEDSAEEQLLKGSGAVYHYVAALIDFPKIIIAAVNGPAVGIGVTILPLCDFVFAADNAHFSTPFVKLGQSAEACSTYTFPRLMGKSKAMEMFALNKRMTAQEAFNCGFVTKIIPSASFQSDVDAIVRTLAQQPYQSMLACKNMMHAWDRDSLHTANRIEIDVLRVRTRSEECMEAVANFLTERSKSKL